MIKRQSKPSLKLLWLILLLLLLPLPIAFALDSQSAENEDSGDSTAIYSEIPNTISSPEGLFASDGLESAPADEQANNEAEEFEDKKDEEGSSSNPFNELDSINPPEDDPLSAMALDVIDEANFLNVNVGMDYEDLLLNGGPPSVSTHDEIYDGRILIDLSKHILSGSGFTVYNNRIVFEEYASEHIYEIRSASVEIENIIFRQGVVTDVLLNNVVLDASRSTGAAIAVAGGASVVMHLKGDSYLRGATDYSALEVREGGSLTIKSSGRDNTLTAEGGYSGAGIGANANLASSGSIKLEGGTINAVGGINSPGVGGGYDGSNTSIDISGDVVTLNSKTTPALSNNAAAIGGQANASCGSIKISGGIVTAGEVNEESDPGDAAGIGGGSNSTGGTISISGGNVKVRGHSGIGSGYAGKLDKVEITAGVINAFGYAGAGIGSGAEEASVDEIIISGGEIYARSENGGAGIGSGSNSPLKKLDISGGDSSPIIISIAWADYAAGIGVGSNSSRYASGEIAISGGFFYISGGSYGSGIGGGYNSCPVNIEISGGIINSGIINSSTLPGGTGIGGIWIYSDDDSVYSTISISGGQIISRGDGIGAGIGTKNDRITISGNAFVNASNISDSVQGSPGIRVIGSGYVVIEGDAEVQAMGGRGAAGIGSGKGETGGDISISGDSKVTAESENLGAGIGSGENSQAGGIAISESAEVYATGGAGGAGIGSGHESPAGGSVAISGSARVTATGGTFAAGIGSGEFSDFGDILISGNPTVTASGGEGGSGIGSGSGGTYTGNINILSGTVAASAIASTLPSAGIGGKNFTGNVEIGAASHIKAYSPGWYADDSGMTYSIAAIQSNSISGDGFFVNAIFPSFYSHIEPLTVAASQSSPEHRIELPSGYKAFAYTTGGSSSTDSVYLEETQNLPTRYIATLDADALTLGLNSKNSVHASQARFIDNLSLNTKTETEAYLSLLSITRIMGNNVSGRIDYWPALAQASRESTLSWGASDMSLTPSTILRSVTGLQPNTLHYAQAYLSTDEMPGGEPISLPLSFSTRPKILAADAGIASWVANPAGSNAPPVLSVPFSFSYVVGNIGIDIITVSVDRQTILIRDNGIMSPGWSLDEDAGVFSGSIVGLEPDVEYDIGAFISNSEGDSTSLVNKYAFKDPTITATVPVKIIFAAFQSNAGDVTSPEYQVTNLSAYPVRVSIASFNPSAESLPLPELQDLSLIMKITGGAPPSDIALFSSGSGASNQPLGTFQEQNGAFSFMINGRYEGVFTKYHSRPKFILELLFELDV
ncbi:MAG: hypothetical protein LBU32_02970 [Clostridiales bacterium]|jgi:hypothetical protein|nr:hypothetical protein [Clostridiales bacterium]